MKTGGKFQLPCVEVYFVGKKKVRTTETATPPKPYQTKLTIAALGLSSDL